MRNNVPKKKTEELAEATLFSYNRGQRHRHPHPGSMSWYWATELKGCSPIPHGSDFRKGLIWIITNRDPIDPTTTSNNASPFLANPREHWYPAHMDSSASSFLAARTLCASCKAPGHFKTQGQKQRPWAGMASPEGVNTIRSRHISKAWVAFWLAFLPFARRYSTLRTINGWSLASGPVGPLELQIQKTPQKNQKVDSLLLLKNEPVVYSTWKQQTRMHRMRPEPKMATLPSMPQGWRQSYRQRFHGNRS